MNILMIGNGFDLAHGLPTKYTHFLDFVNVINQVVEVHSQEEWEAIDWKDLHLEMQKNIIKDTGNFRGNWFSNEKIKSWKEKVENNFWIQYFLQCDMHGKENWIDFESEIAYVIKCIDKRMSDCGAGLYSCEYALKRDELLLVDYKRILKIVEPLLKNTSDKRFIDIRNKLEEDLNRLISAFEWYLSDYVKRIPVEEKFLKIKGLNIDKVLSFNYTDTYSSIYDSERACTYDYIHGEANNKIETNNMVLGIDEYLPEERMDTDVEFITFKKYYQRIHKETGCEYKIWVDEIKQEYQEYLQKIELAEERKGVYPGDSIHSMVNSLAASAIKKTKCNTHNLYIFGHSLDVTDGDVLRDLILNDNVHTKIYYFNKEVMGQQIANLVKVIGQKELIRRTGGSTKTIEFLNQVELL